MLLLLLGCWQTWTVKTNEDCAEPATWYADDDGDGAGNDGYTLVRCGQPDGYVDVGGDCDDGNPARFPGADEVCDGFDDDCDNQVDEDGADIFYADADGDGWGDPTSTSTGCTAPQGTVSEAGDCDDTDVDINPGAEEHCDTVDEDCDGTADNDPVDGGVWYVDGDLDGFGGVEVRACEQPDGSTELDGDCDDSLPAVNPGAVEECDNGIDDNCDGEASPCAWEGEYDALTVSDSWVYANANGSYAGWSMAVGDLDDNGQDEVLVASLNIYGGSYVARVEPPFAEVVDIEVDVPLFEGRDGDYGGWSISVLDFDGDGSDDLAVGALAHDVVYLVMGPESESKLYEGKSLYYEAVGYAVAGGDLDGSGSDELVAGAPSSGTAGSVLIAGDLENPDRIVGSIAGDGLGDALLIEDVSGDGTPDLIIAGASAGVVYIFTSPPTGVVGASDSDVLLLGDTGFGVALAAGDLDGDGTNDLLVGNPLADFNGSDSGSAFLFLAPSEDLFSDERDARYDGPTPNDDAGRAMATADVDMDGGVDLMVTAPGSSSDAGTAHVLLGPGTSGTTDLGDSEVIFSGSLSDGYFGHAALLSDLDGDGDPDPVLSAPYEYSTAGGVWVFLTPGL